MRTQRFTVFMLTIFALCLAVSAWSQPMRMTAQERTDRLAKQLELADSTKAKVLVIFAAADSARAKAFEAANGDRDQMRSSMDSIRTDTDKKLKAVLTAEQYDKYQKARAEMMNRPRPGGQ